MNQTEIKPNKKAYLVKKIITASLISIFIVITLAISTYFTLNEITEINTNQIIPYAITLLMILNLFIVINANVSYKKEKYIILKNKIIQKKGTIFTDNETELIIKNITQVWLNLPFLETGIFKTGNLMIKAAGSGDAEIYMSAIDNPKNAYENIRKVMELEGFELTKKKLIQKEKPNTIAVFFSIASTLLAIISGIIALIIFTLIPLLNEFPNIKPYLILAGITFIIFASIYFTLRFMNLKRRVYYLYEDLIDYEDGFLTENYSFIPIENLADTEITQTLIDRIFDLYDVIISSQGSQNNIAFTNIANGKKFKNNLDELIRTTPSIIEREERKQKITSVNKSEKTTTKISQFTLKMDMTRSILSPIVYIGFMLLIAVIGILITSFYLPIVLIALPIVIIVLVSLFALWTILIMIQVVFTKYYVNSKSIEETFSFLTAKTKEFTNEKITRIKIHENFIDKLFKTISIEFNSIGSGESITFTNIKDVKGLRNKILKISNIEIEKPIKQITSQFTLKEFLKANIFLTITSIILIIISTILAIITGIITPLIIVISLYIISYIQRTIYYKTARLNLYETYVYYTRGILFKTHTYSLYQNIKDIQTKKYPNSELGKIKFNIAGEIISQTNNGPQARSIDFSASYIKDTENLQDKIDNTLLSHPLLGIKKDLSHIKNALTTNIKTTKPSKKNHMTIMAITSIILFPAILLLPITLPITYIILNNISYQIKPARIEKKSGVFYKKKLTILYNRLDHISSGQGFLNKVYKNGDVSIYTTGSSMKELTIMNIPDYKKIYEIIEKNY